MVQQFGTMHRLISGNRKSACSVPMCRSMEKRGVATTSDFFRISIPETSCQIETHIQLPAKFLHGAQEKSNRGNRNVYEEKLTVVKTHIKEEKNRK